MILLSKSSAPLGADSLTGTTFPPPPPRAAIKQHVQYLIAFGRPEQWELDGDGWFGNSFVAVGITNVRSGSFEPGANMQQRRRISDQQRLIVAPKGVKLFQTSYMFSTSGSGVGAAAPVFSPASVSGEGAGNVLGFVTGTQENPCCCELTYE